MGVYMRGALPKRYLLYIFFLIYNKKMQPISLFEVLKQVISSWQVLFITLALLLFLKIFFSAARKYRRTKSKPKPRIKTKSPKTKAEKKEENLINDDGLGLEED